jgi:hypothetical protein
MALSAHDKKLAAIGGGMFLGGQVTNQTVGKNNQPIGLAGSVATLGGTTTLGLVGLGEVIEQAGIGSIAQFGHYGKQGKRLGKAISSSARRAGPGLKILAGKIAQGANQII